MHNRVKVVVATLGFALCGSPLGAIPMAVAMPHTTSLRTTSPYTTPPHTTSPQTTPPVSSGNDVAVKPFTVTSTSGMKLKLRLDVQRYEPGFSSTLDTSVYLTLSRHDRRVAALDSPVGDLGESHSWTISIPNAAFTGGDASTSNAKSDLAGFGQVQLHFAPTGTPKDSGCGDPSSYEASRTGTVTGKLYFATHSKGRSRWGSIGTKQKPLRVSASATEYTDYGAVEEECFDGYDPCIRDLQWTTDGLSGGWIQAGTRRIGYVSAHRTVQVSRRVLRFDDGNWLTPVPKYTSNGNLVITAKGLSPHSAGSLTVQNTQPLTTNDQTCALSSTGTATGTESHVSAPAKLVGGQRITVKMDIFGAIVARNKEVEVSVNVPQQ